MPKRKPTPNKERYKFNRSEFIVLANKYLAQQSATHIVARLNQYRETAHIAGQSFYEAELQAHQDYFSKNEEQTNFNHARATRAT